jgi:hypothetical protein
MRRAVAVALALALLGLVPLAEAQTARGNIYGKVSDGTGAMLPGAAVTLSGGFGTRSTISDAQGNFRFLNLDHGRYRVSVAMAGFGTINREVDVLVGQNAELDFSLKLASVEESLTVTAETPVVDTKKVGIQTTVTKEEMNKIPTSRDPWSILASVPGVLMDRVNIAGAESGQQGNYVGKGADPKNNVWTLDGVVITDMATRGASPTYYTYDSFDQVQVSAGGNDIQMATGGVGISFVTKRGTNGFHGGANGYFTHDKLQSSNVPDELARDTRLLGNDKADHMEQLADYSFELSGPILKDKLWFWGSYGKEDIRVKRLTQTQDKTVLITKAAKVNWQMSQKDMISAFWFLGSKIKIGRSPSSGLQEAASYLVDQGDLFPQEPRGLSKVEWNRVFSPSFFLNAKWAYYSTGFTLGARDDRANDQVWDRVRNEARGNSNSSDFLRPQTTVQLDGNYFFGGMGGNHELKFGASWKKTESSSATIYSGNKTRATFNTDGQHRARFFRDSFSEDVAKYYSAYVGDTFAKDRLTVNLGLRVDKQQGSVNPSAVPANPLIPNLLPAVDFGGGGQGIDWLDVSPRLGITYALNQSRKTVARVSVARYAGQLQNGDAAFDSPVGNPAFLEYAWSDLNGDEKIQLPEVRFTEGVRDSQNINPNNPAAIAASVNQIDPNLKNDKELEILAGVDHELLANFAVGVAYSFRHATDSFRRGIDNNWLPRIGVTRDDYALGTPVTRNGYTVTPFVLRPGVNTRAGVTGGRILTNRPDYSRGYHGIELTATKRLSGKWMARMAFSYMDWTHNYGPDSILHNPNPTDLDPQIDGAQVIRQGTGSGKALYVGAKWQVAANAMYLLPAGFEIAGNLYARQGYPKPIYIQVNTGAFEGTTNILAQDIDAERLPDLYNLDLRLAKNLKFGTRNLVLSIEGFNVFNSNTELNRNVNASSATFNRLEEITAPRIVRVGARFSF